MTTTPESLFETLLRNSAARPFVTYYDEASGERSELSAKSLANWVAKTHFLLTDELGLGVGDEALIALPTHWISVPIVLGCLTAGLSLTAAPADAPSDGPSGSSSGASSSGASSSGASVAFVAPSSVGAAHGVPDVFCIAPETAAFGLRDAVPAGVTDYVLAVRPQGDAWSTVRFGAAAADPCWDGLSRGEVAELAQSRAVALGLTAGARLLTDRAWNEPADWLDTLLAPLAVGGSVVYVRNAADNTVLARRVDQERATQRI